MRQPPCCSIGLFKLIYNGKDKYQKYKKRMESSIFGEYLAKKLEKQVGMAWIDGDDKRQRICSIMLMKLQKYWFN